MEYYLDNTFNPIENKSLSVEIKHYDYINTIHHIKFTRYKKLKNENNYLKNFLPFFLKLKGKEIDFFNINLNFAFFEKVFYIYNCNNRFFTHYYYNNKIFEEKLVSYNNV